MWKEVQRIPKIIFKRNQAGKRDPGRPQKRWKDTFQFNQNLTMSYNNILMKMKTIVVFEVINDAVRRDLVK
jgi:hypothetical protein